MSVDREAVKTLAIAIGVREAAAKLGLNPNTVLSWSRRGKWFAPTPQPPKQSDAITARKAPSQVLSEMVTAGENIKILSLREKREYLAEVVRTPVGKVDEDHPLAQRVKRSTRTDKDGQTHETEEIEIPGKLRAIELDAKLAGELDAAKPEGGLVHVALIRLELPANMRDEPAGVDPAERAKVVDAIEVRD